MNPAMAVLAPDMAATSARRKSWNRSKRRSGTNNAAHCATNASLKILQSEHRLMASRGDALMGSQHDAIKFPPAVGLREMRSEIAIQSD
jgi:hypothetical protein